MSSPYLNLENAANVDKTMQMLRDVAIANGYELTEVKLVERHQEVLHHAIGKPTAAKGMLYTLNTTNVYGVTTHHPNNPRHPRYVEQPDAT